MERLSKRRGGAQIWLKREDLNHCPQSEQLHWPCASAKASSGLSRRRVQGSLLRSLLDLPEMHGIRAQTILTAESKRLSDEILGAEVVPVTSGSRR